jgi:hypothetical protein
VVDDVIEFAKGVRRIPDVHDCEFYVRQACRDDRSACIAIALSARSNPTNAIADLLLPCSAGSRRSHSLLLEHGQRDGEAAAQDTRAHPLRPDARIAAASPDTELGHKRSPTLRLLSAFILKAHVSLLVQFAQMRWSTNILLNPPTTPYAPAPSSSRPIPPQWHPRLRR